MWVLIVVSLSVVALSAVLGPRVYRAFSLLNSGHQVDIGGRELFIRCVGSGRPTVLLEHGLGSNGHEWQPVQELVGESNRTCFVSRAGMGFSDPAPETVRTAADAVDDLEVLLEASTDVDGPYVLVGHSFGGFVVRLFADRYPEQVVGLVLVDSVHEDQTARLREHMSASGWAEVAPFFTDANPEGMDVETSAGEVAAATSVGSMPLVVLEAGVLHTDADGAGISEESAREVDAVMQRWWPELQQDLTSLSSNGRHQFVADSGHDIHVDDPDTVADAIRSVANGG